MHTTPGDRNGSAGGRDWADWPVSCVPTTPERASCSPVCSACSPSSSPTWPGCSRSGTSRPRPSSRRPASWQPSGRAAAPAPSVAYPMIAAAGMLSTIVVSAMFTAGLIERLLGPHLVGLISPRTVPRSGHVIGIGNGQVGLRLCGELRRLGVPVVGVERDPSAPDVHLARSLGIPVLTGHGGDRSALEKLHLSRARALAAVAPTTSTTSRWPSPRREPPPAPASSCGRANTRPLPRPAPSCRWAPSPTSQPRGGLRGGPPPRPTGGRRRRAPEPHPRPDSPGNDHALATRGAGRAPARGRRRPRMSSKVLRPLRTKERHWTS